jgi:GDP/UDP-N,N'-diacetylbacillosamine 2-epimerase (hydrolysing)
MKKIKICVFTGKRGGFGALINTMNLLNEDPYFDLSIIASDMHLSKKFGSTVKEIKSLYRNVETIRLGEYGDENFDRTLAMSKVIEGMAKKLKKIKPDVLMLLGDRGETLAATFAAVQMKIIVAHIQGGDKSGGIDDIHRHAITKLSHIHLTQNKKQMKRVIELGEERKRVFNTGAPYIDNIINGDLFEKKVIKKKYNINTEDEYFILLHHPDTYKDISSYSEMTVILKTLTYLDMKGIVIFPCSDPGHQGIIKAIMEFKSHKKFNIYKTLEFKDFLSLLKYSNFFIGNSSAGIIEAPYFKKPFINIGNRQNKRDRVENVINTKASKEDILNSIKKSQNNSFNKKLKKINNPFGDGKASHKILKALKKLDYDNLFEKKITF